MPEAGIKIDGKHYDMPTSMRVGETRMIKRITGLNPPEFTKALGYLNKTQDPDVGAAMVWWILHREDPSFTIEMIDDLEWGAIESDGEDADPKDNSVTSASATETIASSPSSVGASSSTLGIPAGDSTPTNGGDQALALSGHPT